MNDKILTEDLLASVKAYCGVLMHGTIEAATPQVREHFNNCLFETLKIQNELYEKMSKRGWYQAEMADSNKIMQTESKFANQANA